MEHLNSSDLQRTIAHFEAHDLGFTFPLRDEAYVLSQAPSSNWSNMDAWASFKAKVEMVRDSPALLGYYMCKCSRSLCVFLRRKKLLQGCSIGIVASNEASSVVLANNNLEGQSFAGIVVGSGSNFLIQGAPETVFRPFSKRPDPPWTRRS